MAKKFNQMPILATDVSEKTSHVEHRGDKIFASEPGIRVLAINGSEYIERRPS
jgi:hypothetical protein